MGILPCSCGVLKVCVCLLWFIAINLACINSGWQSPDAVYSCSRVPHSKHGIVATEFPPRKEGRGRQGVSQGQRVPKARRSLSLCLFTCTSCIVNAPVQCRLHGRGLVGFVFHQRHGKIHVQCARGGGLTVINAHSVGGCPKNKLSQELARLLASTYPYVV